MQVGFLLIPPRCSYPPLTTHRPEKRGSSRLPQSLQQSLSRTGVGTFIIIFVTNICECSNSIVLPNDAPRWGTVSRPSPRHLPKVSRTPDRQQDSLLASVEA